MSMPHDDVFSKRPINAGCGMFVGRVGALAVALGIGAAIVNSAGPAWADGTASGSAPGPSTTSTASSGSGESVSNVEKKPDTQRDPGQTTSDGAIGEEDGAAVDETPVGSTTKPRHTEPKPKKPRGQTSPTVTKPENTAATGTQPGDARRLPEAKVATPDRVTTIDVTAAQDKPRSPANAEVAETVSPVADPPAAAAGPAEGPSTIVTGLVERPTTAEGPNHQAGTGPVEPLGTPALLTLVGFARREIGQDANPASGPVASLMSTAQVGPTLSIAPTSPLGTQQQLTAEQVAAQTAATLPVQLMKLVLQYSFYWSGLQLFSKVGGPDQENYGRLREAVDEYAMAAAFQQQILNSNEPTVVMQVAPPHSWYGLDVPGSRILYDNPDTIYRFMGVNAASTYVISGQFTSPRPAETTFSVLTGLSGVTTQVLNGRDIDVNPDGTFTITVSRAPAAPGERNHLQLPNDATLIAARNTLSDWNTQEPMALSIERTGGPPNSLFSQLGGFAIPFIGPLVAGNPLLTTLVSLIPPLPYVPPILRGAVTAVVMALGIQREAQYMAVATTDPSTGKLNEPNVLKNPTSNAEFLATQLQSAGYFQLADDQALVITIDPGDAGYFVVPVTDDWTITDNYWDQQTSLNIAQAVKNADNKTYTIVVSPTSTDPLVTNFVSTGGLNQGTISIRFQDLPVNPTHLPTVKSEVMLVSQLPADIPRTTPADRALQLAARKAGYDNRFAPFPQR